MSEGKSHVCSWKRIPGGYRVWLKADPTVAAEHEMFEEADELLSGLIHTATGDGENVHSYDPPRPALPHGDDQIGQLWILGRQHLVFMLRPEEYFSEGLCENCLMPRGERTTIPLRLGAMKSGVDAAMVRLGNVSPGVGPTLTVVSEHFLALLTPEERGAFEWRPIHHASPRVGPFFEVVHHRPTVPRVSAIGHDTYFGRCDVCGFEWVIPDSASGKPDGYVSADDLPVPPPGLLAVGRWQSARIAVASERWAELTGQPGMRGIKGSPFAIIPESSVERAPVRRARDREKRK